MGKKIFITGGTGYMGSRFIPLLLEHRHQVTAVVRQSSRDKLPSGCGIVVGDALNGASYQSAVEGAHTFIHLVGVSHPSPAKAREFVAVDLKSALESIHVAKSVGIAHFIYLSVAHPAPVMKTYIEVRMKCEAAIVEAGLRATILRPWYVLGPGHRWPYALIPLYKLAGLLPATRAGAIRLGLVNIRQMVNALLYASENPASNIKVLQPADIRKLGGNNFAPPLV